MKAQLLSSNLKKPEEGHVHSPVSVAFPTTVDIGAVGGGVCRDKLPSPESRTNSASEKGGRRAGPTFHPNVSVESPKQIAGMAPAGLFNLRKVDKEEMVAILHISHQAASFSPRLLDRASPFSMPWPVNLFFLGS
jgi:hypothetical protein